MNIYAFLIYVRSNHQLGTSLTNFQAFNFSIYILPARLVTRRLSLPTVGHK